MKHRTRIRLCFGVTLVALLWSVFIFGAAADGYRTVAAYLTAGAGLVCLVWLPGRGRFPLVPWPLAIAVVVLLGFGWFMTVNALADHSLIIWKFFPRERPLDWDWLPGSVAYSSSLRAVIELTLLLVGFLAALRATQSGAWMVLLKVIAIFGALVALTGFMHKGLGAETVWWIDDKKPIAPFAPFVYHGSAGAFMNLCLPVALGLAFSGVGHPEKRAVTTFWFLVSALMIAGVLATASKGAMIILAMLLPVTLIWNRGPIMALLAEFFGDRRRRLERFLLIGTVALIGFLFLGLGIGLSTKRWQEFTGRFGDENRQAIDGRVGIIKLMTRMASPEEGSWHGFGPGSFSHLVPHFTVFDEEDEVHAGRWLHGHSDPLQTLVEWGYLGAAGWFVIGGGAVVCGVILLGRKRVKPEQVPIMRGVVVGLVMVGIHSCVDLPLSIYSIHLFAMLLCAVCWGLYAQSRRELAERSRVEAESRAP